MKSLQTHTATFLTVLFLAVVVSFASFAVLPQAAYAWNLQGSCSGAPSSVALGQSVTWSATQTSTMQPSEGHYEYVWSGTDSLTGSASTAVRSYSSVGTKSATVVITLVLNSGGRENITRSCSVTVTAPPTFCKLEITKTVDKDVAVIGDTLTYTLSFKNTGTADCTGGGVRVKDILDSHLEYLSETHTAGIDAGYNGIAMYTASNRELNWDANILVPGASGSVSWKAKVKTPATCGSFEIPNQAFITAREYSNFTVWIPSNTVVTDVSNSCPPPLSVSCTAAPAAVAVGEPILWSSSVSGGVASYTYSWSGTDGLSGASASTSKLYVIAGTKSGTVTVTSGSETKTATCTTMVTALPPLEILCSVSPLQANTGETITWGSSATGGSGTYTYAWYGTDGLSASAATILKTYTTTGTKQGVVTITSGTQVATTSCSMTVIPEVPATLIVKKIVENVHTGTSSSESFSISVRSGATDVAGSPAVGSATGTTYTLPAGTYVVSETNPAALSYTQVGITGDCAADGSVSLAAGETKTCTITNRDISPPPPEFNASCAAAPASVLVNESISWTASATGSTGSYTYTWSGTDSLAGTASAITKTYSSIGTKTGTVTVVSGTDSKTVSCEGVVRDNPPPPSLNAACTVSVSSARPNTPVTFNSSVAGGNGSYTYAWTGTDGLTGSNSYVTKSYATFGTMTANVTVTSGGMSVTSAQCGLNIIPDGGCTGFCGGFDQPTVVLFKKPATSTLASFLYVTSQPFKAKVAGVYLSEVPYTGVTGTAAVIVFIVVLIIWSAFVAFAVESNRIPLHEMVTRLFRRSPGESHELSPETSGVAVLRGNLPHHHSDDSSYELDEDAPPFEESDVPANLPTDDAVSVVQPSAASHASAEYAVPDVSAASVPMSDTVRTVLFTHARERMTLVSEEAARMLATAADNNPSTALSLLNGAIDRAETKYMKEDGWILLNREKVHAFLGEHSGTGSIPAASAKPAVNVQRQRLQAAIASVSSAVSSEATHVPAASAASVSQVPVEPIERPAVAMPIAAVISQRTSMNNDTNSYARTQSAPPVRPMQSVPPPTTAPVVHASSAAPRVAEFLRAVAAGNREQVLTYVRTMQSAGSSVEEFIASAILELDRVHRSRIENDAKLADAEITRIASGWGSDGLEEVIAILLSIAEHSYKSSSTGLKLAVMRIERLVR